MTQMTNSELTKLLNARLGLAQQEAVTVNVVRQWVAWDVLPKARVAGKIEGKGPIWSRPRTTLRRANRLGELRKQGIKRENALIVQAYIEWGHPDFDRVQAAMRSEWEKWAAQLTRRQTTFIENSVYEEISATQQRAITNQIGPISRIFRGTKFEQSPEIYALIADFARTGEANLGHLGSLFSGAFFRVLPEIAALLPAEYLPSLASSFAGMTGPPDEIANSAASTIESASERQFRTARHQIRIILKGLHSADQFAHSELLSSEARQLWQMLQMLSPQITAGPWLIFLFVQALKYEVGAASISEKIR